MLEDTDLLKSLKDAAVDGTGGVDVLGGTGTPVLGVTVDLAKTANTDGLAEVDVTSDTGGTNVEPVDVLRGELSRGASLNGVDPT